MSHRLAIHGGVPVRKSMLPYGCQSVDESDIQVVAEVLRSDWLTTGPKVLEFEQAFADLVGQSYAVSVSSGTAALHAAMYALGITSGDEVIVPAMTFVATANCVVYQGGTPIFCDVEPDTLLLDPDKLESKITSRSKAILVMDYAGHPCDYDTIRAIADRHGLALVADACHSLGGSYKGISVGSLADLNVFSFHPVKAITTGEGGMITTDNEALADELRIFRNHGVTSDHRQRADKGSFFYEMAELGFNYRLTDFQSALGLSQLYKLPEFVVRRQEIAVLYDVALSDTPAIFPLTVRSEVSHAYHLYVVQLDLSAISMNRAQLFAALRAENIGANVHYIPVYWHPYYRHLGYQKGICPIAETAYQQILSLPIYPRMSDRDVETAVRSVGKVISYYAHAKRL